jgi:hypothetical protein
VIDVFVDALDLAEMSFDGVEPAATGRPSYHPSVQELAKRSQVGVVTIRQLEAGVSPVTGIYVVGRAPSIGTGRH